jgi:hypothetical protein
VDLHADPLVDLAELLGELLGESRLDTAQLLGQQGEAVLDRRLVCD